MPEPTSPELLPRLAAIVDDLTALVRDLGPRSRSLTALADEHAQIEAELGGQRPTPAANVTRTSIARAFGLDSEEMRSLTFDGTKGSITGSSAFTSDHLAALQRHVGLPVRVIVYTDQVVIEWGC